MNSEAFRVAIGQLYSSAGEIAGNIANIRKELPSLTIPQAEKLRIGKVCEEFEGAVYDVRKEIRNLEDKLGMHPGEEPFDPDIKNPDPRATMGFIDRWLRTEIEAMHQTVLHLDGLSKADRALGGAYLLVAESAANILNGYSTVQDALSSIRAALEVKGA